MNTATTESPLARICRQARERRARVLAHPDLFTREEVERASLAAYQDARISIASTLRYD